VIGRVLAVKWEKWGVLSVSSPLIFGKKDRLFHYLWGEYVKDK
jgi:hypothetical protein